MGYISLAVAAGCAHTVLGALCACKHVNSSTADMLCCRMPLWLECICIVIHCVCTVFKLHDCEPCFIKCFCLTIWPFLLCASGQNASLSAAILVVCCIELQSVLGVKRLTNPIFTLLLGWCKHKYKAWRYLCESSYSKRSS